MTFEQFTLKLNEIFEPLVLSKTCLGFSIAFSVACDSSISFYIELYYPYSNFSTKCISGRTFDEVYEKLPELIFEFIIICKEVAKIRKEAILKEIELLDEECEKAYSKKAEKVKESELVLKLIDQYNDCSSK